MLWLAIATFWNALFSGTVFSFFGNRTFSEWTSTATSCYSSTRGWGSKPNASQGSKPNAMLGPLLGGATPLVDFQVFVFFLHPQPFFAVFGVVDNRMWAVLEVQGERLHLSNVWCCCHMSRPGKEANLFVVKVKRDQTRQRPAQAAMFSVWLQKSSDWDMYSPLAKKMRSLIAKKRKLKGAKKQKSAERNVITSPPLPTQPMSCGNVRNVCERRTKTMLRSIKHVCSCKERHHIPPHPTQPTPTHVLRNMRNASRKKG